jgi:cellulose synthase operon protein YhjU
MEFWAFYFLFKLYLHYRGWMQFHAILNLALFAFIFAPVPEKFPLRRSVKFIKVILSIAFAVIMLWYDSWLPSLSMTYDFLANWAPSKEYMLSFLAHSFDPWEALIVLGLLILAIFITRKITLVPITAILLLVMLPGSLSGESGKAKAYFRDFHRKEAGRVVKFEAPGTDFDIIFLHVCSLSWDDLRAVDMDKSDFFKGFQILFTNFNSVTSYSNPSALRLMRANCGQEEHDALYESTREECYMMDDLRKIGYQTYTGMDHDGRYMNFGIHAQLYGKASPPIDTAGIPALEYNFDNSPILDAGAVLEKWHTLREASGARRAALYFNSIPLHGGSRRADASWTGRKREQEYRDSLTRLLAAFENFFRLLAASGRNTVVVFIPEHGMALRGSNIQAPDLRDIPLPRITTIPVGIKIIGRDYPLWPVRQQVIGKSTSYLALAQSLSYFLKDFSFNGEIPGPELINNIPETPYVSENRDVKIVKMGKDYYLSGKDRTWTKLPPSALE